MVRNMFSDKCQVLFQYFNLNIIKNLHIVILFNEISNFTSEDIIIFLFMPFTEFYTTATIYLQQTFLKPAIRKMVILLACVHNYIHPINLFIARAFQINLTSHLKNPNISTLVAVTDPNSQSILEYLFFLSR